jgi:aspartyl-tRNA synthetase
MCAATGAPRATCSSSPPTAANVCKYLSWLRETVAKRRGLIPKDQWNFLWVHEFPMFEWSEEDQRYYAMHHPFTAPRDEDVDRLESEPTACRAKAYDLVLNGTELAGGSIRIHRADVQQKVFKLLDITPEEQEQKFGFLLRALASTARRPTAGSPTASTASSCCSAASTTSATRSRSPRPPARSAR